MYFLWGFVLTIVFHLSLAKYKVLCQNYQHTFPGDNGALQLILKSYTGNLLRELRELDPEKSRLTPDQAAFIESRMRDFYDHIRNHPALYQRYFWVGKEKPTTDPDRLDTPETDVQKMNSNEESNNVPRSKKASNYYKEKMGIYPNRRRGLVLPSEEICKTDRRWERLNSSQDFYENEVEIVQDDVQQYVFTYRCVAERGACIGISPLYDSECAERYGWIYMFYRKKDAPQSTPQWGYVATPHHCACKITPKYFKSET